MFTLFLKFADFTVYLNRDKLGFLFLFLQDYIFSLLTGYNDPPAGIEMKEGLYYHPYFPGGFIAMAQALYNEIIEYEDGKVLVFQKCNIHLL